MAADVPDENQESPLFSSPNLQHDAVERSNQFGEFEYQPGLFHIVTEVTGGESKVYVFSNNTQLVSMGELSDPNTEYNTFKDVAMGFMPSIDDTDRHELVLVPKIKGPPWSTSFEENAMLLLLDRSVDEVFDIDTVRAYYQHLNNALWRTKTSGLYVVAHYTGAESSTQNTKIAARVAGFILHEERATIEPVILDSTDNNVGLLPVEFALAPKWLYRLAIEATS